MNAPPYRESYTEVMDSETPPESTGNSAVRTGKERWRANEEASKGNGIPLSKKAKNLHVKQKEYSSTGFPFVFEEDQTSLGKAIAEFRSKIPEGTITSEHRNSLLKLGKSIVDNGGGFFSGFVDDILESNDGNDVVRDLEYHLGYRADRLSSIYLTALEKQDPESPLSQEECLDKLLLVTQLARDLSGKEREKTLNTVGSLYTQLLHEEPPSDYYALAGNLQKHLTVIREGNMEVEDPFSQGAETDAGNNPVTLISMEQFHDDTVVGGEVYEGRVFFPENNPGSYFFGNSSSVSNSSVVTIPSGSRALERNWNFTGGSAPEANVSFPDFSGGESQPIKVGMGEMMGYVGVAVTAGLATKRLNSYLRNRWKRKNLGSHKRGSKVATADIPTAISISEPPQALTGPIQTLDQVQVAPSPPVSSGDETGLPLETPSESIQETKEVEEDKQDSASSSSGGDPAKLETNAPSQNKKNEKKKKKGGNEKGKEKQEEEQPIPAAGHHEVPDIKGMQETEEAENKRPTEAAKKPEDAPKVDEKDLRRRLKEQRMEEYEENQKKIEQRRKSKNEERERKLAADIAELEKKPANRDTDELAAASETLKKMLVSETIDKSHQQIILNLLAKIEESKMIKMDRYFHFIGDVKKEQSWGYELTNLLRNLNTKLVHLRKKIADEGKRDTETLENFLKLIQGERVNGKYSFDDEDGKIMDKFKELFMFPLSANFEAARLIIREQKERLFAEARKKLKESEVLWMRDNPISKLMQNIAEYTREQLMENLDDMKRLAQEAANLFPEYKVLVDMLEKDSPDWFEIEEETHKIEDTAEAYLGYYKDEIMKSEKPEILEKLNIYLRFCIISGTFKLDKDADEIRAKFKRVFNKGLSRNVWRARRQLRNHRGELVDSEPYHASEDESFDDWGGEEQQEEMGEREEGEEREEKQQEQDPEELQSEGREPETEVELEEDVVNNDDLTDRGTVGDLIDRLINIKKTNISGMTSYAPTWIKTLADIMPEHFRETRDKYKDTRNLDELIKDLEKKRKKALIVCHNLKRSVLFPGGTDDEYINKVREYLTNLAIIGQNDLSKNSVEKQLKTFFGDKIDPWGEFTAEKLLEFIDEQKKKGHKFRGEKKVEAITLETTPVEETEARAPEVLLTPEHEDPVIHSVIAPENIDSGSGADENKEEAPAKRTEEASNTEIQEEPRKEEEEKVEEKTEELEDKLEDKGGADEPKEEIGTKSEEAVENPKGEREENEESTTAPQREEVEVKQDEKPEEIIKEEREELKKLLEPVLAEEKERIKEVAPDERLSEPQTALVSNSERNGELERALLEIQRLKGEIEDLDERRKRGWENSEYWHGRSKRLEASNKREGKIEDLGEEIKRLDQEHEDERLRIEERHREEIREIQKKFKKEHEDWMKSDTKNLDLIRYWRSLCVSNEKKVENLEKSHKEEISELKDKTEEEIKKLKKQHEEETKRLTKQHEDEEAAATRENLDLKHELQEAKEKFENLEKAKNELESKHGDLELTHNKLVEESKSSAFFKNIGQAFSLKTNPLKFSQKTRSSPEDEEELKNLKVENTRLNNELGIKGKELDQKNTEIANLTKKLREEEIQHQKELQIQKDVIDLLNSAKLDPSKNSDALVSEIASLKAQIRDLDDEVNNWKTLHGQINGEKGNLENENSLLLSKISTLQLQLQAELDNVHNQRNDLNNLKTQLSDAQGLVAALQAEKAGLEGANLKLDGEYQAKELELQAEKQKNLILDTNLQDAQREITRLTGSASQLATVLAENLTLKQSNITANSTIGDLKLELNQEKTKTSTLASEKAALEADNQAKELALQASKSDNATLQNRCTAADNKVTRLTGDLNNVTAERDKMTNERDAANLEVTRLGTELANKTNDLDAIIKERDAYKPGHLSFLAHDKARADAEAARKARKDSDILTRSELLLAWVAEMMV